MALTSLPELRRTAQEIFTDALAELDAGRALRRAVDLRGSCLTIIDTDYDLFAPPRSRRPIYAIGVGKAAVAMATALDEILGERIVGGVLSAPPGDFESSGRWRVFAGGHPLPNAASLEAARAAFELLAAADRPSALIFFLVSGGGSAMLEWPRDERLTLDDLRETNRVLVSCGASIAEINSVRRHLSTVKGGGLSRRARRASHVTLIVSDTLDGRAADVASGPSLPPPTDAPPLAPLIARYNLDARLPARVRRALACAPEHAYLQDDAAAVNEEPRRASYVLLDNGDALQRAAAAARARGLAIEVADDLVEQEVTEGARLLAARLYELYRRKGAHDRGVCLISGGEFSCPVRGHGVGGRNAETALRCALAFAALRQRAPAGLSPSRVVALCAGTDGLDGNSPAAGAVVDHTTIERAIERGFDARRFIDESDAYTLFDALGDTIVCGATGTNVRDLRILLAV